MLSAGEGSVGFDALAKSLVKKVPTPKLAPRPSASQAFVSVEIPRGRLFGKGGAGTTDGMSASTGWLGRTGGRDREGGNGAKKKGEARGGREGRGREEMGESKRRKEGGERECKVGRVGK